jgi:AbrB family looped-hinge helix DNA binding protein
LAEAERSPYRVRAILAQSKEVAVPTSTLTSKGQVTIPQRIRERLGLKVGDRLEFRLDASGRLLVVPEPASKVGRVPGLLSHLAGDRPVTIEEMDEGSRERARRKYEEAVRR